jgi:hypothetical protein
MKRSHIRDEVDAEFDRMKWLHQARKAGALGIGDIAAPPGGWPAGAAPKTPARETPPAHVRAGAPPVRYAEPQLPAELAHPDMAPFRLPAARAAVKSGKAKPKARAGAVDPDVSAQRGRRNAARKVAAALAGMK